MKEKTQPCACEIDEDCSKWTLHKKLIEGEMVEALHKSIVKNEGSTECFQIVSEHHFLFLLVFSELIIA